VNLLVKIPNIIKCTVLVTQNQQYHYVVFECRLKTVSYVTLWDSELR